MKNNIMVDIETLGTKEGSTIFQISAATFDIETGEIGETIDLKGDIEKMDVKADGSTLKWWLKTDKELFTKLLNEGTLSEFEMLDQFAEWVRKVENPKLWGNGILFDNAKIKSAMESKGINYPIAYNRDLDVRTILFLASKISGKTRDEIRDEVKDDSLVAHDALDDVIKQINFVSHCYSILENKQK